MTPSLRILPFLSLPVPRHSPVSLSQHRLTRDQPKRNQSNWQKLIRKGTYLLKTKNTLISDSIWALVLITSGAPCCESEAPDRFQYEGTSKIFLKRKLKDKLIWVQKKLQSVQFFFFFHDMYSLPILKERNHDTVMCTLQDRGLSHACSFLRAHRERTKGSQQTR